MTFGHRGGIVLAQFMGGSAQIYSEVKHASKAPFFAGITFFVLGMGAIPLAFITEHRNVFVLGYMATPLLVLTAVAWDAMLQRRGSRDPWFSPHKRLSATLRFVAIASFVPAILHIWQIATWLGEIAVQNGWFS